MKVAVEVRGPVEEPYFEVRQGNELSMILHPGFIEVGKQRSAIKLMKFQGGELGLCAAHTEHWFGSADMEQLTLTISEAALRTASDSAEGEIELLSKCHFVDALLVDARLGALAAAVNAERIAGFPGGSLFLDSVEQALAVALVDGYAVRRPPQRTHRGGLGPARLRRIKELVQAKIEDELTLNEMADAVELSIAHFSRMFRDSTGQSPHQFVLRNRVERAKEMLRTVESRVLDVAVACGFKTQQHFARVFRRICGVSPTEYRQEFLL
jgi:AraC family transcriptional regulator